MYTHPRLKLKSQASQLEKETAHGLSWHADCRTGRVLGFDLSVVSHTPRHLTQTDLSGPPSIDGQIPTGTVIGMLTANGKKSRALPRSPCCRGRSLPPKRSERVRRSTAVLRACVSAPSTRAARPHRVPSRQFYPWPFPPPFSETCENVKGRR